MTTDKIPDPLKPISKINEPDSRQRNFLSGLEDNHNELSEIIINTAVPVDVRQLFETAKNLSLYSWYVYPFHQVAELIGFSALEMALRLRYYEENPAKNPENDRKMRPPSLAFLMKHAQQQAWISNEKFPSLREQAKRRVQESMMFDIMRSESLGEGDSVMLDEPTEDQVLAEMRNFDYVAALVESAAKVRNDLAHGSNTLTPNSIWTLQALSEVINQLYE